MQTPEIITIGGEKLLHRVGYKDCLQDRMRRWEIANHKFMADLDRDEWIRVVSAIGYMSKELATNLYYTLRADYSLAHPSSWHVKEREWPDKLTDEFLRTIRLPLSIEDYHKLKEYEDDFNRLTHGTERDLFYLQLSIAYGDMWENERICDPNLDSTVAYGDL